MLNVRNVLVAHDFSPGSYQALSYALDLADRTGATLHLVYAEVLHGSPFDPEREPPSQREKIRTHLQKHAGDLPEHRVVREVVRDVAVAPALLRYAEEHDVDLGVMGTHGRRGVRRMLIGSVAEEVVRRATCPVLTVRQQKMPPDADRVALTLLHVVEEVLHPTFYGPGVGSVYDVRPDIEDRAMIQLQRFYREAKGPDVETHFVARPGRAAQAIVRHAEEEDHDLIVMATHGRTGLEHFLMGSVAEKVVRSAPCPLFTVKSFSKTLVAEGSRVAPAEE